MKRLNPKTGKPFKAREEENGRFFRGYDSSRINSNGYFRERWDDAVGKENVVKRLNPKTGKPFKQGDIREDGYIFKNYEFVRLTNGYAKEKWMSPDNAFRWRINKAFKNSKNPRKRGEMFSSFENNLDIDYLISIFPKDKKCPVFGFEMEFGGESTEEKDKSPSLDRIDPKIGYIKGNVQWISTKANRVKTDQNLEEIVKLKDWAEKILNRGIEAGR